MRDLTNNTTTREIRNPFSSSEDQNLSSDYQISTDDAYDDSTNLLKSQQDNIGYHNRLQDSQRSSQAPSQTNLRGDTPTPSNPFVSIEDTLSPFGGYPIMQFPLSIDEKEPDDYLHNPDPIEDALYDKNRFLNDLKSMDKKSFCGLLGVIGLFVGAMAIFVVLPVLTYSNVTTHYTPESYEILTQYQYPTLSAIRTSLVDPDSPSDAQTYKTKDGDEWKLVFSDEFNAEGRTFYEGDDQFFTAPDLNYAATKDLEWYDPDAVTTVNGTLNLRMDAYKNHDLFYRSGMIQSWNKLCYTQGLIRVSASLPYYGNVSGLWPGLWSMGNLGRPGYMSTTEGVWPYTYDSCDAGITPNQSSPDGISYLPGQKLNVCTCKGQDHPNTGVGRGAPEIDIIEAEIDTTLKIGVASQSLQIAPFDIWYMPDYSFIEILNSSVTTMNTYAGGPFQQAVSGTTVLNRLWYEHNNNKDGLPGFQVYGYEYMNDDDTGYITWYVGENPTLTLHATSLHPNGNIGWRRIPKEPMSIIANMGMSNSWAYIDWSSIHFPLNFKIDYIRLYQPEDAINLTCDPADYPTYQYIEEHLNAYSNVNFTSWKEAGYTFPKHKLNGC
ncbi:beta-glucan synthesis-associated protein Kre6p [[Candida] railenensis]|uniref:Beta-glucan synthesis-associated protein Kre6p n=1 Tax=[Candida] railenensis TaxID=45579 RepID=A0A9P0W1M2_9ASCO|nr:beta-glucan synthesis-associated protein Kre6p [[Candida] railenensis]